MHEALKKLEQSLWESMERAEAKNASLHQLLSVIKKGLFSVLQQHWVDMCIDVSIALEQTIPCHLR